MRHIISLRSLKQCLTFPVFLAEEGRILQPAPRRCGYNDVLISDVERVLKQFEFLEDQYDTTRIRQKGKNADVGVGSSVKHTVRQDISHHDETLNNLEALQKLQNSVKEVNQLFTEESLAEAELSVPSSGIFYAEVVMAR